MKRNQYEPLTDAGAVPMSEYEEAGARERDRLSDGGAATTAYDRRGLLLWMDCARRDLEANAATLSAAYNLLIPHAFCDATDKREPCNLPTCRACRTRAFIESTEIEVEAYRKYVEDLAVGPVYTERNRLVTALAWVGGYPLSWADAPDAEGYVIVYLESPAGQLSWHMKAEEATHLLPLSGANKAPAGIWDGHTTEKKYERLAWLRRDPGLPQLPLGPTLEGSTNWRSLIGKPTDEQLDTARREMLRTPLRVAPTLDYSEVKIQHPYAIVQLMGHMEVTGRVHETRGLIAVDECRDGSGDKPDTRYFGMAAIYSIRPCTADEAVNHWPIPMEHGSLPYCPEAQRLNGHEDPCEDGTDRSHDLPF